jgi:hypothetical protein
VVHGGLTVPGREGQGESVRFAGVAVPIMACSEPIGGHGARACVRVTA